MEHYIDGIYCYCDHWCERCPFTARCAVFTGAQIPGDPSSPEFWQEAMAHFAATHPAMGDAVAFEVELRAPTPAELEAARQRQEAIDRRLSADPLLGAALAWQEALLTLMEDRNFWRSKARATARDAALGIRSPDAAMEEAGVVTELLGALRRYAGVIADRLAGALLCLLDEAEDLGGGAPEGLAKVALVSIGRSREALAGLYAIFADEDRILPLFGSLGALERAVEAAYPGARAFARPGFDEPAPLAEAS